MAKKIFFVMALVIGGLYAEHVHATALIRYTTPLNGAMVGQAAQGSPFMPVVASPSATYPVSLAPTSGNTVGVSGQMAHWPGGVSGLVANYVCSVGGSLQPAIAQPISDNGNGGGTWSAPLPANSDCTLEIIDPTPNAPQFPPACNGTEANPCTASVCGFGSCFVSTRDADGNYFGPGASLQCSVNGDCVTNLSLSVNPLSQTMYEGESYSLYTLVINRSGPSEQVNFGLNCPAGTECQIFLGGDATANYGNQLTARSGCYYQGPDGNGGYNYQCDQTFIPYYSWSNVFEDTMTAGTNSKTYVLRVRNSGPTYGTFNITANTNVIAHPNRGCVGTCSDSETISFRYAPLPCNTHIVNGPSRMQCSNQTQTSYQLNWTPGTWDGVAGQGNPDRTVVRASTDQNALTFCGANTTCLNSEQFRSGNQQSVVISGLQPGTTYFNRVAQICTNPDGSFTGVYKDDPDTIGWGGNSANNWSCSTLPAAPSCPSANMTAFCNGGSCSGNLPNGNVTVSWNAVTGANSYDVIAYDTTNGQNPPQAILILSRTLSGGNPVNGTSISIPYGSAYGGNKPFRVTVQANFSSSCASSVILNYFVGPAAGSCTPGQTRSFGTSPCTGTETCTAAGTWPGTANYGSGPYASNGTSCPSSANQCTINRTCTNGVCGGGDTNTCVPTECQLTSSCNGSGGCSFTPRTGQSCNGGTGTCNSSAQCVLNTCPAGAVVLTPNTITEGNSVTATPPTSGWSGGTFSSDAPAIASVSSGSTVFANGPGTATISGVNPSTGAGNWTAPNGATGCSLSGTNLTVTASGGSCVSRDTRPTGDLQLPNSVPINTPFQATCGFGSSQDNVRVTSSLGGAYECVFSSWVGSSGPATFNCPGIPSAQTVTYTCQTQNVPGSTNWCSPLPVPMQGNVVIGSSGALPNLTAGSVSPATATAGTSVPLSAPISNNGTASTGSGFTDLFQRANDSSGTGAIDIGTFASAALGAGGSNTATLSYTFSSAGTYYVRACADKASGGSPGTIAESDNNDNCGGWTQIRVDPASPPPPPPGGGSPTVTISASPLSGPSPLTTTITWIVNNATSCTGSNGSGTSWPGAKAFSNGTHTQSVSGISVQTVFTITCFNGGNSSFDSVTVTPVLGGGGGGGGPHTVTVTTNWCGTVTSVPAGINCGSSCQVNMPGGTSVQLTANPLAQCIFAGWSGPAVGTCSGNASPCNFTVNGPTTIEARFILRPFNYEEF